MKREVRVAARASSCSWLMRPEGVGTTTVNRAGLYVPPSTFRTHSDHIPLAYRALTQIGRPHVLLTEADIAANRIDLRWAALTTAHESAIASMARSPALIVQTLRRITSRPPGLSLMPSGRICLRRPEAPSLATLSNYFRMALTARRIIRPGGALPGKPSQTCLPRALQIPSMIKAGSRKTCAWTTVSSARPARRWTGR
jgi:hypothetical protein